MQRFSDGYISLADLTDVEVAISPEFERMASYEQDRYGNENIGYVEAAGTVQGTAEPDQSTFPL